MIEAVFPSRPALRTLLLASLALVLAACGSSDDPTGPGDVAPSGPRVEVPGGGGEDVTIEVLDAPPVDTPVRVTPAYRLGPEPIDFGTTGELRLPVAASTLDSLDRPEDLIGGVFADGAWYGIPESRFDLDAGELVIPIDYVGPATLDSAAIDTTGLGRSTLARSGAGAVFYGATRGGGNLFAGLRPIYVSRVGGSDVPVCGSESQPCRTMAYALNKAGRGEKVVLQGPGAFTHPNILLDLPPNARLEGRNGASLEDVTLRAAIPGSRPAVRNLAIEQSGGGGNLTALVLTAGELTAENVSSRSTGGLVVRGGILRMRGGTWRDSATFFDIGRGDRDHEFDQVTIRGAANTAVVLQGDARAVFRGCTFRANGTGIFVPYFGHVEVTGSTFRSNGYGVVVGEFPNTRPEPVTATATIRDNTFRGITVAGVKLQTPAWEQVRVDGIDFSVNEWENDPPLLWNGPAPWIGTPDVVNLFAPLGAARWWPLDARGPSARLGAAMGWDEDLQRVILFGGLDAAGNALDDTWSFDPSTNAWQQESVLLPPSPRVDAAIASAPASQRLFLFGGRDNAPTPNVYDDLYLFDSAVSDWIPLSPSSASQGRLPGARHGASFVALSSNRFLLYGGIGPGGGTYGEWWVYDATANEWTDLTPGPNAVPAARYRGFAAGAAWQGDAYFYGGTDANGVYSNLLGHFDDPTNRWGEFTFTFGGPQALAYASLEIVRTGFDPPQMLLFGGQRDGGFQSDYLDETWLFGNLGGSIGGGQVANGFDDVRPPARARHASATFPRGRDRVCMIFGGTDGLGSVRDDTWIWSPGGSR